MTPTYLKYRCCLQNKSTDPLIRPALTVTELIIIFLPVRNNNVKQQNNNNIVKHKGQNQKQQWAPLSDHQRFIVKGLTGEVVAAEMVEGDYSWTSVRVSEAWRYSRAAG